MKLSAKLTLIATAIAAAAVLVSTILIIEFAKQNTEEMVVSAGIDDFSMFYTDFSSVEFGSHIEELNVYLQYRFCHTTGFEEYALEDGDDILSNTTGIDVEKVLDSKGYAKRTAMGFENPIRYTICSISGQDYLIVSTVINIMEHDFSLSLAREITQTMDGIRQLAIKCAVVGGIVVILAAAIAFLLTRRSLKPIGGLEAGASEMAAGNYENRIPISGHDEIAMLAEKFNIMAAAISDKIDELKETAQRQQAFVNGLSHEMKTPVTSIMARSETLLVRDLADEDKKRSLERIYDQCAWLERLSGKLTALTMLDGNIEKKPVSVSELFAFVEETVVDTLKENGIHLNIDCQVDLLTMDTDLMRSALVNLIENAKRASEPGESIELVAKNNAIAVTDHGKGIPAEELPRITEPFYMVDRSRSKKSGGSGLGLALVKRIAEAHNAKLEIASTVGCGTIIRLVFPDVDK